MCKIREFKIEDVLLFILIMLMLLVQTELMEAKLSLFLIIGCLNLAKGKFNPKYYESRVLHILAVILLYGLYCIVSGILITHIPDSELSKKVPFLLIHPLLFYLLLPNMMGSSGCKRMCNIMVFGHVIIICMGLYNIIALFRGLPLISLSEKDVYDVSDYGLGVRSGTLYQAMITTPIFFAMGFSKKVHRYLFWIIGILTVIYAILASRAALTIVTFGSLLVPFLMTYYFGKSGRVKINKIKTIFIVLAIFTIGVIRFGNSEYVQNSYEDFMAHFDESTDIRFDQRRVLWDAWIEKPIFGHGYGAYFNTYNRGLSNNFESMYHAKLATTGVIGLGLYLLYMGMILWPLHRKIKSLKSPYYLALFLSLVSCLICSTTNPTLATFDRLITIYMCVACVAASQYFELRSQRKLV